MPEIVFYLSIIPTLAIVLGWHEAGHLVAAKIAGVRATAFSIGAGPPLASYYSGNTVYHTDASTTSFSPDGTWPTRGQMAVVQYRAEPDGSLTLLTITKRPDFSKPFRQRGRNDNPEAAALRQRISDHSRLYPTVTGRVKRIEPGYITLADMQWRVGPIPFAAYVALPEDPSRTDPRAFNNAHFLKKAFIMASGVTANLALPVIAVFLIFALPHTQDYEHIVIDEVKANSPADAAGLRPDATIISVQNVTMPSLQEFIDLIDVQDSVNIKIKLANGETIDTTMSRDPATRLYGFAYRGRTSATTRQRTPGWILESTYLTTANIYSGVYRAFAQLVSEPKQHQLTSAVGFTMDNARIVERIGFTGWLLTLTILSISAAIFNILPIPPLDGGKMIFITVESLRRGRPIPTRYQYAITSTGIAVILSAGIFLIIQDIFKII